MHVQLIRHATLLLHIGGLNLLVDPMLSPQGANPPILNTANDRRNPLVDLPFPLEDLLAQPIDAVLITHTHRDHFDEKAAETLPKHLPVLCQLPDYEKLTALGFHTVLPVANTLRWRGLDITRTDGEHGTGEIAKLMAPVSGFVLKSAADDESVYIAGDTIWCPAVAQALTVHAPQVTVVNAGGARFVQGDPITMTAADVIEVCRHAPDTQVIAVHLDAINHCLERRGDLQAALEKNGLHERVCIPHDGETVNT